MKTFLQIHLFLKSLSLFTNLCFMLRLDEIAELFLEFPIIKAEFSNGDATREIDSIQPKFKIVVSVSFDTTIFFACFTFYTLYK